VSTIQSSNVSRSVALAAALVLAAAASPARAGDAKEPADSDIGMGVAAGLATLVYAPAKVVYAIGGGVAAGLAYVVSAGNTDVTEPILTPSVRGDYIVTPAHLRGEKPLEFFGREPGDPAGHHATADKKETPPVSSGDGLDAHHAAADSKDDEGSAE
jgi:hypothetical protein